MPTVTLSNGRVIPLRYVSKSRTMASLGPTDILYIANGINGQIERFNPDTLEYMSSLPLGFTSSYSLMAINKTHLALARGGSDGVDVFEFSDNGESINFLRNLNLGSSYTISYIQIVDGKIYIFKDDYLSGVIYKYDLVTGNRDWSMGISDNSGWSTPYIADDGSIFVGTNETDEFLKINPDSTIAWRNSIGTAIYSVYAIPGTTSDHVFVGYVATTNNAIRSYEISHDGSMSSGWYKGDLGYKYFSMSLDDSGYLDAFGTDNETTNTTYNHMRIDPYTGSTQWSYSNTDIDIRDADISYWPHQKYNGQLHVVGGGTGTQLLALDIDNSGFNTVSSISLDPATGTSGTYTAATIARNPAR